MTHWDSYIPKIRNRTILVTDFCDWVCAMLWLQSTTGESSWKGFRASLIIQNHPQISKTLHNMIWNWEFDWLINLWRSVFWIPNVFPGFFYVISSLGHHLTIPSDLPQQTTHRSFRFPATHWSTSHGWCGGSTPVHRTGFRLLLADPPNKKKLLGIFSDVWWVDDISPWFADISSIMSTPYSDYWGGYP